jgi:hypothetical protein
MSKEKDYPILNREYWKVDKTLAEISNITNLPKTPRREMSAKAPQDFSGEDYL